MITPAEFANVFVRPHFYDALSGEFKPSTDERGITHTLARLAVGTYVRGSRSIDGIDTDDRSLVRAEYTPSWAPITSVAYGNAELSDTAVNICGLHLFSEKSGSLEYIDALFLDMGRGLVILSSDVEIAHLPLSNGDNNELFAARATATETAQAFFETL